MKIELLNELFETGVYAELYNSGLISHKVATYRDYYLFVDKEVSVNGLNKTQAVKKAAEVYKVEPQTIWNALKSLSN